MSADGILADWVDAAAKAMWETSGTRTHPNWELEHAEIRAEWRDAARDALEAVAPLIAAQALKEAADAMDEDEIEVSPSGKWTCDYLGYYGESEWLRERAARIVRGEADHA